MIGITLGINDLSVLRIDKYATAYRTVGTDRRSLLGVLDPQLLGIGLCRVEVHAKRCHQNGAA